jgi:hypothetical protein
LTRRWPVALIGILCTASVLYLVHKRPIVYQACGSLVVTAVSPETQNAYNSPVGPLIVVTSLITQQLSSDHEQDRLRAQGLTASYQAQILNNGTPEVPTYTEPFANVCASSYSSDISLRTAVAVLNDFGTLLNKYQTANPNPKQVITASVVLPPIPLPVTGRPSQAYLGVVAIGTILTLACITWVQQLTQLLARRRGPGGAAGNGGSARKRALRTLRPWRSVTAGD